MTDPNAPLDPYAGIGEDRPQESSPNTFWKPTTPERIIGKLDHVASSGKYGDRAVFPKAITYRLADHRPLRTGEVVLGIGANLVGRISAADSGRYFVVTFKGFSEAKGEKNPMRLFDVSLIPLDREATLRAAMAKDAARLEADAANLKDDDDDLPF